MAIAGGHTIAASDLGKTKMAVQVLAVSLLLVSPYYWVIAEAAYIALWAVVLFAVVSMVDYFRTFWSKVDGTPLPRPTPIPAQIIGLRKERKQDVPT